MYTRLKIGLLVLFVILLIVYPVTAIAIAGVAGVYYYHSQKNSSNIGGFSTKPKIDYTIY